MLIACGGLKEIALKAMGDAKRRKAAYLDAKNVLLTRLQGDAVVVAETAIKLFDGFIFPWRYTGGCYLTTMILHRFLDQECGIITEPVVGFVNDGTDDIMISHAWLEYDGCKTDLTLHLTDGAMAGSLIIMDQVLRQGQVSYSYHRKPTEAGLKQNSVMLKDPDLGPLVRHKLAEHETMEKRAKDPRLMSAYLASAPAEQGYAAMTQVLR